MSDQIIIYHNPRCSKSRAALDLLRSNRVEPEIIEYLKTPPDIKQFKKILIYSGGETVGDGLYKISFLYNLRRAFSKSHITWMA